MNGPADFFRTMLPYARRVSELTGVDPRLVLAQSALETGYGKSAPGQNFFGIKAPAGQGQGLMTMEFEGGQMVPRREAFRTYDDPSQSFQDYANLLLRNDRYAPVREARTLEDQIRAMGASGYATDPEYANKLRSIAYGIDLNAPELIASDAMSALGRGADTSGMMATTEARPAMNGRQMTPGLLAQDAAATARPMPAQPQAPARDYGNLLDTLAIGFSGLSMRPNQALISAAQERIKGRREQAQRNATADWLESQGMTQQAEAVRRGVLSGAEALTQARPKEPEIREVDGRLLSIDPTTGGVTELYSAPPKGPDQDAIANARKEFVGLAPVKAFADQTSAYGRVVASAKDPSPAGDLALIFNYMKVLDPGSVVREGEFATAQNAGGVDERVRGLYNRIMSGERLTPEQRSDFADRSTRLYRQAEDQYKSIEQQYRSFAQAAGLPVEQVIPDFTYSGNVYETPLEFQRPPAPQGVSEQDWSAAWSAMTDEERRQFLNGGM